MLCLRRGCSLQWKVLAWPCSVYSGSCYSTYSLICIFPPKTNICIYFNPHLKSLYILIIFWMADQNIPPWSSILRSQNEPNKVPWIVEGSFFKRFCDILLLKAQNLWLKVTLLFLVRCDLNKRKKTSKKNLVEVIFHFPWILSFQLRFLRGRD